MTDEQYNKCLAEEKKNPNIKISKDQIIVNNNVTVYCRLCGNIFTCKIDSIKCNCHPENMSRHEKLFASKLTENQFNYRYNESLENCYNKRPLRPDFIMRINGKKVIVEVDDKGTHSSKKEKLNDKIKNEFCKNNGIILIRIAMNFTKRGYKTIAGAIDELYKIKNGTLNFENSYKFN